MLTLKAGKDITSAPRLEVEIRAESTPKLCLAQRLLARVREWIICFFAFEDMLGQTHECDNRLAGDLVLRALEQGPNHQSRKNEASIASRPKSPDEVALNVGPQTPNRWFRRF